MTFRLRDGLSIGDQSVITYDGELIGNDFYYENTLPTVTPTLNLNFLTKKLDPRITFTRGSTATYTDQFGNIATAAANVPRFDHDPITGECTGLLIEEERTNLLTYSDQFNDTVWVKSSSTISSNLAVSPDGTLTADKIIENSSTPNTSHYAYQNWNITSGTTYTFSVYAKAAERTQLRITFNAAGFPSNYNSFFDLSNGTVLVGSGYATIISAGNGWYRCSMTSTATVTGSTSAAIYTASASSSVTNGDGVSGIYIWGAQLEVGSIPTSYIPTTSATVTRYGDTAYVSGTNFSSWYNQTEGTLLLNAMFKLPTQTEASRAPTFVSLNDNKASGGNGDQITIDWYNNEIRSFITDDSSILSSLKTPFTSTTLTNIKVAYANKLNDGAAAYNGALVNTDTDQTMPTATMLVIGARYMSGAGTYRSNTTIKSIKYYPKRLTNAELQAITL